MLLASCGHTGLGTFPNDQSAARRLASNGYKLLYSFAAGKDAGYPYAGLTDVNGTLYGTTYGGGGGYQWGTVYKISIAGKEQVLYRFKAGHDGAHPYGGLLNVNGTLYGTTYQGGASGDGTVFRVSPSGAEQVIYSFKGGSDGQYPYGGLVDVGGELYGTTFSGGVSYGWGVVFKVSTSGMERVLYRFKANQDGAHPYAGLTAVKGTLYGTTYQGGAKGSGTVYSVSLSGSERVLYSFKAGKDGQYPYARLYDYNGTFYGTTYQGGIYPGWGVVYKVSPAGKEEVLYRFKANSDGAHPQYDGLIAVSGMLYGTTYQGGTGGAGVVFSVTTAGVEHVLYSFQGGNSDGQYPYDGLLNVNNTLYGTTYQGGASNAGTVFKILPGG